MGSAAVTTARGASSSRRRATHTVARPSRLALGAAPVIALVAAGGLVMIAYANNGARESADWAAGLFWAGLTVIYAPIALRLLSARASRAERIALILVLGMSLFVVKILSSPVEFVRFDEAGTWRATNDVLQSGHFLSYNPIAVSTAGFPGLEAITASLVQLTGLSVFHAGVIVIGVARATLMLALFLFLEHACRSQRAAGIGVAIYACNPSFLYFDSQFAYESLALAVAAGLILLTLRRTETDDATRRREGSLLVAMLAVVATLTITHHMSSFAVLTFLLIWTGLIVLSARTANVRGEGGGTARVTAAIRTSWRSGPGLPAAMLGASMLAWFAFVAGEVTVSELGSLLTRMVDSTADLIFGRSSSKTLFSGGGESTPATQRALAFASVIPVLVLLPFGARAAWRGSGSTPLWRALTLVGLAYPLTLALRLTLAGSETSQRASEFTFVGIAFFAALVIGGMQRPSNRWRMAAGRLVLATSATIVFLGGVVLSELPATRQPGPFEVGADARSLSPEGENAAEFAADNLPPESRVIVDRSNAMLLASEGGLNPVFGRTSGIPVPQVLFGRTFGPADRTVIREQQIDYVIVDRRLSLGLPVIGFYIENDEAQAYTRETPLARASLKKFAHVLSLRTVYDNGPITIYDVSALRPEE